MYSLFYFEFSNICTRIYIFSPLLIYYISFEVIELIAFSCPRRMRFAKFKRTTIDVPLRTVILFINWMIDLDDWSG